MHESSPDSLASDKFTFVTVIFEGSKSGMILQARSLAKYLPCDLVEKIIVIDNSANGSSMGWLADLQTEYGDLWGMVSILRASDIADVSEAGGGWWSQQILKLKIAEHIRTPVYVLLDCKHYLVKPLARDFLTRDGKLRIRAANYAGHPLLPNLKAALAHFSIPDSQATHFPTTTPPFPFAVDAALEVVDYAEKQSGSLKKFMADNNITEFFLYSAYLISKNRLSTLYELHSIPYPVLWPGRASPDDANEAIAASRSSESPFFGVHRRAGLGAHKLAREKIAEYLFEAGLVASQKEGVVRLLEGKASLVARGREKIKKLLKRGM